MEGMRICKQCVQRMYSGVTDIVMERGQNRANRQALRYGNRRMGSKVSKKGFVTRYGIYERSLTGHGMIRKFTCIVEAKASLALFVLCSPMCDVFPKFFLVSFFA